MPRRKCEDCEFYVPTEEPLLGKCARFPPAASMEQQAVTRAVRPVVPVDGWCGEWKRRRDDE